MNELIAAAKAVIEVWDAGRGVWDQISALRTAVERAESSHPVRLSDEEILAIAEKYGTSSTRHKPTYHLHDGSPTGETYPITDWDFGQDDLFGFARELLEKADE